MPAFRFARMSILLPVVLLVASGCTYAQTDTVRDPVAPSQSAADEFSIHKPGWAQSVEAALIAGRFDDLDRLADQYRREKTRLKGGDWCLREFYAALDAPQQSDKDSQQKCAAQPGSEAGMEMLHGFSTALQRPILLQKAGSHLSVCLQGYTP